MLLIYVGVRAVGVLVEWQQWESLRFGEYGNVRGLWGARGDHWSSAVCQASCVNRKGSAQGRSLTFLGGKREVLQGHDTHFRGREGGSSQDTALPLSHVWLHLQDCKGTSVC